jgi:dihydroxyacetone kinase-like predicted kinase
VAVSQDQPIALIDDELTDAAETPEDVTIAALVRLNVERALVTIFLGRETEPERGDALAERVRGRFAGTEVEVLPGGQPFYDYVISVE